MSNPTWHRILLEILILIFMGGETDVTKYLL